MNEEILNNYKKLVNEEDFKKLKTIKYGYENKFFSFDTMKSEVENIVSKYMKKKTPQELLNLYDNTNETSNKIELMKQYPELEQILRQRTQQQQNMQQQYHQQQQQGQIFSNQNSNSVFEITKNLRDEEKLMFFQQANYEVKEQLLRIPFYEVYLSGKKIEYEKLNEIGKEKYIQNDSIFNEYIKFYDEYLMKLKQDDEIFYKKILEGIEKNEEEKIIEGMNSISKTYLQAISLESMHSKTIIQFAIEKMNSNILEIVFSSLLKKHQNLLLILIKKKNFEGNPPLIFCILNTWIEGIKICLKYGCSIYDRELTFQYTSYHVAIQSTQDILILDLILNSGQFLPEKTIDQYLKYSIIEYATLMGKSSSLKTLYSLKNKFTFFESNRLYYLAYKTNTIGIWQTMISLDPDLVDSDGFGSAHIISMSTNKLAVKLLKEVQWKHPKKVNDLSNNHFTPLMLAIKSQKTDVIVFLLQNGADLKIREKKYGMNALMMLFLSCKLVRRNFVFF